MTLKIGDVSSYQGNYGVGSNGEDGIIAKVTEGTGYLNPNCNFVLNQAISKGIPFGGYHFASLGVAPEAQAEYHYQQAKGYFTNPNYVDILDFEIGGDATDFIVRYVNHLKAISGAKTIWVYGGQRVLDGAKATNSPLWFAGYPYASSEASPATWITPDFPYDTKGYLLTMWQFTTSGGEFDRSIFYGDVNTWKALSVHVDPDAPVLTMPAPQAQPVRVTAGKNLETLAGEVQAGIWGSGNDRVNALGAYATGVQAIVNERAHAITAQQSHETLAGETKAGKYGNGADRQFLLGSYYQVVQDIINGGTQPAPVARTYTVVAGDSLSGIGAKLGTSWQALAQANGIADPNRIYPGQVLKY